MLYGTRLHSTPALLPRVSGLTRTFTTALEALHGSPSRVVRDSDLRYRYEASSGVTATPTPYTGPASVPVAVWLLDGFAGRVPNEVEEAGRAGRRRHDVRAAPDRAAPMNRCGGYAAHIDAGNALADRAAAQLAPLTPTETRLPAKNRAAPAQPRR
jgi:hypothetical protein